MILVASAITSLSLFLWVASGAAQPADKPADWLPYNVAPEIPREIKPEVFDRIRSGMTLGRVVALLGKGWVPPNSGTGVITWGCTDGRNLKVRPKRYISDEVVSFEPGHDESARMWIERGFPNDP